MCRTFYESGDVDALTGLLAGQDVSGSPRLWVDSGSIDTTVNAVVWALRDDPLQAGKKRVIVATADTAGSPVNWTENRFAGQLMQITNGALTGRIYLIESNTSDTLDIATESLDSDGVVAGGSSASQFCINGLLMAKANSTQQDVTAGITYKLTIPMLSVGTHKYHFTARSRQTVPQWLSNIWVAAGQSVLPYSALVRCPVTSDYTGPTVQNSPPANSVPPVLSNTQDTSVYYGPQAGLATVATASAISVSDTFLGNIRQVLGVYLSAGLSGTNYYSYNLWDPTDPHAATPSSTTIALTQNLPTVAAGTTLVQGGAPYVDSSNVSWLLKVAPDVPSAIGSVLGVYTSVDTTGNPTGINYFASGGSFPGGLITLGLPLPSGTTGVYIQYSLIAGATWPPVYVQYFANSGTSTVFLSGAPLTFRVNYSDANDYAPTFHDGVQGYIDMMIDGSGADYPMRSLLNPVTDYTQPTLFSTTLTTVAEGKHEYHFEASDGYYVVDFPTGTTANPEANDYTLTVHHKPVISAAGVNPAIGQTTTPFVFTCQYLDADVVTDSAGNPVPVPTVLVRLIGTNGAPVEFPYIMKPVGSAPNYAAGARYSVTVSPDSAGIAPGNYSVTFEASDGYQQAGHVSVTPIAVRNSDVAPVLSNLAVNPSGGKSNANFTYSATYTHNEDNPPYANSSGSLVNGITLLLDVNSAGVAKRKFLMTMSPNPPLDTAGHVDYTQGVQYQVTLTGAQLGAGVHNFTVAATDLTSAAQSPGIVNAPVLLVPYFEGFRVVPVSAPTQSTGITTAAVGDQTLVVGSLKFPYNTTTGTPGQINNIVITVTKPDSTTLSLSAAINSVTLEKSNGNPVDWAGTLVVTYPSGVDPALVTGDSLTLDASGVWQVSGSWAGNTMWDPASTTSSENAEIVVGGPMRTVAVANGSVPTSAPMVDMITPPMYISSSDPGEVFGYNRAVLLQLVRWDPAAGSYFRYGVAGSNFTIDAGDAVWIMPETTYPFDTISQANADTGWLSFGNPGSIVNYASQYRLITVSAEACPTDSTGRLLPVTIPLQAGWNMFGNIFWNWEKDSSGNVITPRVDVGLPIDEAHVQYLGVEKTLADASTAGWISDYAWRWDATHYQYVLVSATLTGAERVLTAWSGYWIWAEVSCQLVIDPNTTYNGPAVGTSSVESVPARASTAGLNMPPPPYPK